MDEGPIAAWQHAERLAQPARPRVETGDLVGAGEARAEAIAHAREGELTGNRQDSLGSPSVLWEVATDIAREGDIAAARGLARSIRNEGKRSRARASIDGLVA